MAYGTDWGGSLDLLGGGTGGAAAGGGGIMDMLKGFITDPNMQQLLMLGGQQMDPEGWGGGIARAGMPISRNIAFQKAAQAKQKREDDWRMLFGQMMGLTPGADDIPGLTKKSQDAKGNWTMTMTPPAGETGIGAGMEPIAEQPRTFAPGASPLDLYGNFWQAPQL